MCKHGMEAQLCFVCNGRQAMVRNKAVEMLEGMEMRGIFTGKELKKPREGSDLDFAIKRATRNDGVEVLA